MITHLNDRLGCFSLGRCFESRSNGRFQLLPSGMVVPHPEVSTAYTAYVLKVMADIAEMLGKTDDAKAYRAYVHGCTSSYQALRRTEKLSLDTDRQADLVRPLYFGLLDEDQAEYAKKRLIEALDRYGWRVGTGFLSTPLILYVLADIDIEYAYKLLENEEMPGFLLKKYLDGAVASKICDKEQSTSCGAPTAICPSTGLSPACPVSSSMATPSTAST